MNPLRFTMNDSDVLLVNLNTGETINADYYNLMEMGLPDGYVAAHTLTPGDWVEALRNALATGVNK
jgi:hypothetical protein